MLQVWTKRFENLVTLPDPPVDSSVQTTLFDPYHWESAPARSWSYNMGGYCIRRSYARQLWPIVDKLVVLSCLPKSIQDANLGLPRSTPLDSPQARNWQVARGNLLCLFYKKINMISLKANPLQHFLDIDLLKRCPKQYSLVGLNGTTLKPTFQSVFSSSVAWPFRQLPRKSQMSLFRMSITVQLSFLVKTYGRDNFANFEVRITKFFVYSQNNIPQLPTRPEFWFSGPKPDFPFLGT